LGIPKNTTCDRDDRIGGSINESEFDRWNAIYGKVLGLNECGVDETVE